MTQNHVTALNDLGACSDAVQYAAQFSTLQKAWDACERGDWMLWLIGKQSGPPESEGRKKLVLTACACARLALPYAKSPAVLKCIETAEAWTRGDAIIEEVRETRRAAAAAYAYAAAAAAAADAYAYAAAAAAYAAAAYAAAAAADAYARAKTLKQCAEIVRQRYPKAPELS